MIELTIASVGAGLVICALVADQRWLDRHFLPSFFLPRDWYVRIETSVRAAFAAVGISLALLLRPYFGRAASRSPAGVLHVAFAAVLAFGAGEFVLRRVPVRPAGWFFADEEPRRRADATLGWTLAAARIGHDTIGGRAIDYAIDPAGYRVRRLDEPVDRERPTILFTGESVMFGEGLTWEESIPAQVAAITGIQSANLAVHGYGNDQAFLRLTADLPRFRRPLSVVSLFMPALFGRNLADDRPHLEPSLAWTPARRRGRLASLAMALVPYRTDKAVERGVMMTRNVLRATIALAQAHRATPIIVVPQLGREDPVERALRKRVLDEAGIPYVWIEIDEAWRLPWDRHPNARAAHTIAVAIASQITAPAYSRP